MGEDQRNHVGYRREQIHKHPADNFDVLLNVPRRRAVSLHAAVDGHSLRRDLPRVILCVPNWARFVVDFKIRATSCRSSSFWTLWRWEASSSIFTSWSTRFRWRSSCRQTSRTSPEPAEQEKQVHESAGCLKSPEWSGSSESPNSTKRPRKLSTRDAKCSSLKIRIRPRKLFQRKLKKSC